MNRMDPWVEKAVSWSFFRLPIVLLSSIVWGTVQGTMLEDQRDLFLQAEAALEKGKRAEYAAMLSKLEGYPLLGYLRYRELSAQPDESGVDSYLLQYKGSYYADRLRKQTLRRLAGSRQWRKFIDLYRDDASTGLQCSYYQALFFSGRRSEALDGAKSMWLSGESRPDECDALFDLLRKSKLFTPDLAWQRFRLALEKGNKGLAKYLQRDLASSDRAAALFALEVHDKPERVVECPRSKKPGRHDGWIFAHGIERMVDDDLVKSVAVWDARRSDYGLDKDMIHRVDRKLAMFAVLRRYPFAYSRFQKLDPAQTDQDARFWRIRAALTDKRWDRVSESIELLPADEKNEVKWKYWLARALDAQGKKKEAEDLFLEVAKERDYYGFLAADRTGLAYSFSNRPIDLGPEEQARLEGRQDFAAIRELLALGREAEAKRNWWYMVDGLTRAEKALAAKIAEKWGLHQVAVFTAAKAEHWDDLSLRFPVLFTQSITRNSERSGLSPALVFGLVRQESVFDEQVVSNAGAIGLMQIMPATGRQIAKEINEPWRSQRRLFDPDTNIRFGTHYLKNLLDRFGRNLALAAAGYNAGPHRVQRWLPVDGPLESDVWVEIIPYRETRKYVRYVLGYTVIYQHRLQSAPRKLRDYMPLVPRGDSSSIVEVPVPEKYSCH